ncbi:MAG: YebC/PmpR family DNA-binding transcriptional regulator [Patescibacteria group bacterium]|nr:YebC/PmpR family DNA-binding transcriptional regulator [Patescibacteria group bacterium]
MSGHSKWSTIKHQKEVTDKRRGQVFSKFAKAISVAARDGVDPDSNFKLRLVIEKAKAVNMPKANIERAIEKAQGSGGGGSLEEILFEGYGPAGVAVMVEVVTDNRNRSASEVKNIFERSGGSLAGPGSVSFQFSPLGSIIIDKERSQGEDALLALLDIEGVEDLIEEDNDLIEIYTKPQSLTLVKDEVSKMGFKIKDINFDRRPNTPILIKDKQKAEKVLTFMSALEEHDDVQNVFANFDIPDQILKEIQA